MFHQEATKQNQHSLSTTNASPLKLKKTDKVDKQDIQSPIIKMKIKIISHYYHYIHNRKPKTS